MSPHVVRPGVRMVALLAVPALLWGMAGCAGDSGSDEDGADATTTTEAGGDGTSGDATATGEAIVAVLGEQIGTDGPLSTDGEEVACVGGSVIDELGDAAAPLADPEADPTVWSDEERTAVELALNECLAGASVADDLTAGFYEGLGLPAPGEEMVTCVADALDAMVGIAVFESVAAEGEDDPSNAPETVAVLDGCMPAEDFQAFVSSALVEAGQPQAQADCTARQLQGRVGIADFVAIDAADGVATPEVQTELDRAATNCGG